MNIISKVRLQAWLRPAVIMMMVLLAIGANAQITTSSLSGQVTEKGGEPIIGASVVALHQPSGTRYSAVTNINGRYSIQGMRVGGPYEITYSYVGMQTVVLNDINLELGENTELDIYLEESVNALQEVVVTGKGSKFIQAKTGATTNISRAMISSMPTVNRSISDIVKLSPYSNGMSFAGADGRSTNFTIDGSNFNNNFGLTSSLPGGGNPISLDAIDEMQVVVSPFDVRQTNFIGGGINAITKSGTNNFKGTAYIYHTDQNLRGNRIDGKGLGVKTDDSRTIYGFTLGGPIIRNKLFFFVNLEHETHPGEVTSYRACADGEKPGGNISRTTVADMQRVKDHLMQKYNYDPGSITNFPGDESNTRFLARLDWNITNQHRLSLRFNTTRNTQWNGPNNNSSDTGYRLTNTYRMGTQSMAFSNSLYSMKNNVTSLSFDLNSRFNDKLSNQLLFTYSYIEDMRGSDSSIFPFIDIMAGYNDAGNPILEPYMSAGYELFTYNNGVKNKVFTLTDNVKWLLGSHSLTGGFAFEHQMATNAYMRNGTGYYRYNSVDDFLNDRRPESFAITYGFNGVKDPNAEVAFNQFGLYLQDDWNITRNFKLSYGIRLDEMVFDNDALVTNTAIYDYDFGGRRIDTGKWPKNQLMLSPRVGFNWDVKGDRTLTVRGGTGIFTGRLPLVFFTNMPTNANFVQNGVTFQTTYTKGTQIPESYDKRLDQFVGGMITNVDEMISKFNLPTTNEKFVASEKIAGVDPDFRMPQVWKSSIGVDYKLPVSFPLTVSGELIYMRNFNSVNIENWNIKPQSEWSKVEHFAGADNRVMYPKDYKYYPGKMNAGVLTNTSKGHGLIENITVNARPVDNLSIMASYTHTANREVSGMPGSDPVSTWSGLITVDGPNFAGVQCSQYVVPNKLIASVDWMIPFKYKGLNRNTHLSLFYSGYSRNGYSYCYSNDMNGDGISNDLMYIPRDNSEINFKTDADRDAYWAFAEQDKYLKNHKGQYAEAYSVRNPWTHRFDFRIMEEFQFRVGATTNAIQLSFDIMNIGNLINSKWGVNRVNNYSGNSRILKYEGVNDKNEPVFSMVKVNGAYPTESFQYNQDRSQCWQMQIGIKYLFN